MKRLFAVLLLAAICLTADAQITNWTVKVDGVFNTGPSNAFGFFQYGPGTNNFSTSTPLVPLPAVPGSTNMSVTISNMPVDGTSFTFRAVVTNLPPLTVSLVSPTNGTVLVNVGTVNLVANVSGGTSPIAYVEFYVDNLLVGTVTNSSGATNSP